MFGHINGEQQLTIKHKIGNNLSMYRKRVTRFVLAAVPCMALLLYRPTGDLLGQDVAEPTRSSLMASAMDYEHPTLLTGMIYELGSQPPKILFTFKRTAVRSGSAIRALREYFTPDGTVAARERVVYEDGRLVSYQVEQLQSGAEGVATIQADAKHPEDENISFEYRPGPRMKQKRNTENVHKNTLINDMIAPFMLAHWNELMSGAAVKFRLIVLPRTETVGFKLVRKSEASRNGKAMVVLKMEPTSPVISHLVAPIIFSVEKEQPHRILEYVGRTTPQMKVGNKWKDLDGLTVFDWRSHS